MWSDFGRAWYVWGCLVCVFVHSWSREQLPMHTQIIVQFPLFLQMRNGDMILFMELCDFDLDHYVKQSPFNQRDVKLFLSHMGACHPHTWQVASPSCLSVHDCSPPCYSRRAEGPTGERHCAQGPQATEHSCCCGPCDREEAGGHPAQWLLCAAVCLLHHQTLPLAHCS